LFGVGKLEYNNILIVKLSAIGDVIHALPVAHALKQCNPGCRITWLVEKPAYDLLTNNPNIDEIIIFDKPKFKSLSGLLKNGPEMSTLLKSGKFDLAIDLQGLFKSAAFTYFSGAPVRVGYCNMRELSWIVSKPICGPQQSEHVIERYLDVARGLGCQVSQPVWNIEATEAEKESVEDMLAREGILKGTKFIVVAPGTNWASKCWAPEKYAEVAAALDKEYDIVSVIIGGPKDTELAQIIKGKCNRAIDLCGKTTLKQLSYVMQKSALFIGGDTGPMHLAVSMNTPVIAIFGPTDPKRNGPYGQKNTVIQSGSRCSPCFKRHCTPLKCMEAITVEDVLQASKKYLSNS
jgi:heptosyltransferase I